MPNVVLIIISIIIAVEAILLTIIYLLNKKFRSYPCYFNIIFSITVTLDNLLRLIPAGRGDGVDIKGEKSIACQIQAFTLTFFDKLMLALMTTYSVISFLGSYQMHFYRANEKLIFIVLTLISIIISAASTTLFYLRKISDRSEFCYVETKDLVKQIVDTIITSILFIISLFCIIKLIIKIYQIKKDEDNEDGRAALKRHFIRFIFDLIITSITFTYVILLINKKIPFDNFFKDLIYILLSLIVELFFTINSELVKEVIRIVTCNPNDEESQEIPDTTDNLNEDIIAS